LNSSSPIFSVREHNYLLRENIFLLTEQQVVVAETARMSGESQESRENASPSADVTRLMNAVGDNRGQRSPSKMIQDFEDLFRQELAEVGGAGKVFAAWEDLKRVVLMRVLDATVKRTTTMKTQDATPSYAETLKMGLNSTVKAVPKRIEREITILRRECPPLDGEEAKPARIVETVNTKIGDNGKGKVIAARKLPSGDIVLTLDSAEAKNHMVKETSWATALGPQARVARTRFTVMAKHVAKEAISQADQKAMVAEINAQNPRIHGVVEILHVGRSKRSSRDSARAGTLIIDVATPRQANTLIQEGLILQGVLHDVEVFHRDCLITRCYQCQRYGHTAKVCRSTRRCGFCAGTNHGDDQCPAKGEGGPSHCPNCSGAHPAWAGSCQSLQKAKERAIHAYNNRPACFAVSAESNAKSDSNSGWITIPATGKRKLPPVGITGESPEESQKRGPGRPIGSKNTLTKPRERADSRSIQEMFLPQQETNTMDLF
jgi:hypothetical protein